MIRKELIHTEAPSEALLSLKEKLAQIQSMLGVILDTDFEAFYPEVLENYFSVILTLNHQAKDSCEKIVEQFNLEFDAMPKAESA